MAFKLQHRGGKFVHAEGGSTSPGNSTKLVLFEGCAGGALLLTKESCEKGWFKLKHPNGKYIHPEGGVVDRNNIGLVLHGGDVSDAGGDHACKFQEEQGDGGYFVLKHYSGKYVHPAGGKLDSDDNTPLVLHDGTGGSRIMFKKSEADEEVRLVKLSWQCLMSKPQKEGKLSFHDKVTSGYTHEETLNSKFSVKVQAEAATLTAKVSAELGAEMGQSFKMNWNSSTTVDREFEMPAGSPGYVYMAKVEARTSAGTVMSWNGQVRMTNEPLTHSTEKVVV